MFEIKPLVRGLAVAFGGLAGVMIAATPAQAQTAAPAQKLDRVEVTGSMIKRAEGETALSVQVLKMDDLQKAGVTTAERAVQFIAENQSATVSSSSVGASNGGASYADLRGLGPQRTLVLLNGQRVVSNPYSALAVDLNAIPMVAIERIEVLRDGASAIYGSDAIAGVINIITRKEYQGISVGAETKLPQGAGGQSYAANLSGGYGSLDTQGWNVWAGVNYQKQKALRSVDRAFGASGVIEDKGVYKLSGTTFPATYFGPKKGDITETEATNPSAAAGCAPPNSIALDGNCYNDFTRMVDLIPEQEQVSFMGRASMALGTNNTLSLEYFRSANTLKTRVAGTPLVGMRITPNNIFYPGGSGGTPITNPDLDLSGPINPDTGKPIWPTANWRTTEAGQRSQTAENTTDRVLLSLDGNAANWNYNAAAYYSGAKLDQKFTNGYVNRAKVQAALDGNAGNVHLNPFGPQTAEGLAYLNAARILGSVQTIDGTLWGVNATASRELFNLPAGPVNLAVGGEYRGEDVSFKNNFALIRQAASSGLELASDAEGQRKAWALMGEFSIPIIKNLDLSLAARYDDYNDVGSAVSPKLALRFQPISNLLLRGSVNKGFRAPSLYDLHSPASITNTAGEYNDPLLCPNGVVDTSKGGVKTRDCSQQFNRQTEGNKDVKPEKSDSWSLGFVFDATSNFSFGADYWNTKVKGQINTLPDAAVFSDLNRYAANLKRCGQIGAQAADIDVCSGNPNVLAYVFTPTDNLGDIKASGIDVNATLRSGTHPWGRLSLQLNGTYMLSWEQQLYKGGDFYSSLGRYSQELDLPTFRWQHVISASWQKGDWTAMLFNRLKSGYADQNNLNELDAAYAHNKVGGYSVWDLSGTWQGIKGLSLTAGVLNLFNEAPPFSNQGSTFQVGYDPRFTNPLGRTYMLKADYSFK